LSDPAEVERIVAFWLGKAREALESARAEQVAGRSSFAANRAYYAAFYAASAAMLKLGRRFVRHSGLRRGVHRELVKGGLLDRKWGMVLDRLFESRQRADYLEMVEVDAEEAAAMIEQAEGFALEMERLIAEARGG
jgi:uncharacterized protein (UPF0332 family)